MYDLVQHDQSSIYSPLVQWAPTKFPEPLSYTGGGPVVMDSPHGRSTLGRFYLVYINVSVWGPDRGGLFQPWSYKGFICCGFKVLIMDFDIAYKKPQHLICFLLMLFTCMGFPVPNYHLMTDIQIFGCFNFVCNHR